MLNSTPWSSLYSTELKYKLKIYSSILPRVIVVSSTYLVVVFALSIVFFEQHPALVQCFFVLSIVLFFVAIGLFNSAYSKIRNKPEHLLAELVLLPEGLVELNQLPQKDHVREKTLFKIHPNSRVGFLGCWLCLTSEQTASEQTANEQTDNPKSQTLFIFKNSVCQQDYCRLCRIIKRKTFNGP